MKIEAYEFGRITYGDKTYTADLIIYPDRVDSSWRRREGHLLQIEDLENILKEGPGVLIIGTGAMGVMKVPEKLKKQLQEKNIQVYIEKTGKAVEVFNSADKSKKVIGAFHLTC